MTTISSLRSKLAAFFVQLKLYIDTTGNKTQASTDEDQWILNVNDGPTSGVRFNNDTQSFEIVKDGEVVSRLNLQTGDISTIGNISEGALIDYIEGLHTELLKLNPIVPTSVNNNSVSNAECGTDIALSDLGNVLVVGAPQQKHDTGGTVLTAAGIAYVYRLVGNEWTSDGFLISSAPATSQIFGYNLAISGDGTRIAVGVPGYKVSGHGNGSGKVDIFVYSGGNWVYEQSLYPPNPNDYPFGVGYGVSINTDGTTVVIGGTSYISDTDGMTEPGVVVFTRTGSVWSLQQVVQPSGWLGGTAANFGRKLALSGNGNVLIVAASGHDEAGTNTGRVWVFTRTGGVWTEEQSFTSPAVAAFSLFGRSIDISRDGNIIAVGSTEVIVNPNYTGRVHLFDRTGGGLTLIGTLAQETPNTAGYYAETLTISGDGEVLLVGERGYDQAHLYNRNSNAWDLFYTFTPSDGLIGIYFGYGLGIDYDGTAFGIGAPNQPGSEIGVSAGKFYIFSNE